MRLSCCVIRLGTRIGTRVRLRIRVRVWVRVRVRVSIPGDSLAWILIRIYRLDCCQTFATKDTTLWRTHHCEGPTLVPNMYHPEPPPSWRPWLMTGLPSAPVTTLVVVTSYALTLGLI